MADMKEMTPEVIETPEVKPNTFTQEDVSNIVAKNVKEERAKILKEFGIENVEEIGNAKEAIKAQRELQEQRKTDLEKAQEKMSAIEIENATLKARIKETETRERLARVLDELKVDPQYHKAVLKLVADAPEDDKELKELVSSTIKEFLPGVLDQKDVGFEKKPEKKPESGTKQYLNDKYKNNPFYRG